MSGLPHGAASAYDVMNARGDVARAIGVEHRGDGSVAVMYALAALAMGIPPDEVAYALEDAGFTRKTDDRPRDVGVFIRVKSSGV
jgi:hypothetical protein